MLKLYCNRCGKEIPMNHESSSIEICEREYLGDSSFRTSGYHDNYDLHLCIDCHEELLQFLGIKKEESLPWE